MLVTLFDFLQDFLDAGHAGLQVSQCGCGLLARDGTLRDQAISLFASACSLAFLMATMKRMPKIRKIVASGMKMVSR
jgi:hypothetical protein